MIISSIDILSVGWLSSWSTSCSYIIITIHLISMILPEGLVHRREMDHCVRVHTVLVQGPPEEEAWNASTYAFSFMAYCEAEGIFTFCCCALQYFWIWFPHLVLSSQMFLVGHQIAWSDQSIAMSADLCISHHHIIYNCWYNQLIALSKTFSHQIII